MQDELIRRACELLEDGTVNRVLGWQKGQFVYDITPAVFTSVEEVKNNFVYNDFCGANLSKYLRSESEKEGKVLVFLKPCDTYSFNQLLTEYKIHRDNVYAVGIECYGKADVEKLRAKGIDCITDVKNENGTLKISTIYGEESVPAMDVMAERCLNCKSKKHVAYDELIGEDGEVLDSHRFDEVEEIEKMSAEERFKFWQSQLSKCIRCNACQGSGEQLRGEHVPHHPRVPCRRTLHRLWRVFPRMPGAHSASSAEQKVHQGLQRAVRSVHGRRGGWPGEPCRRLHEG